MISLPCSHCQTVLTIDEAFAGGVCRCQHCGTIQTVPANLKKGDSGPSGKTLYKHPHRGDSHVGTGLQNINDTNPPPVAERKAKARRAAAPVNPDAPPKAPSTWKLYAAASAVALVGAFIIYLLLHTQ
ncbi:MAG TPA: hypothetical protein VF669_12190 [Tepidisphaeraceae bacterium]|jgi:hypothetical protein